MPIQTYEYTRMFPYRCPTNLDVFAETYQQDQDEYTHSNVCISDDDDYDEEEDDDHHGNVRYNFGRFGGCEWRKRRHGDRLKLSSKQRRAMLLRRRRTDQQEEERRQREDQNLADGNASDSGYTPEELQAAMMELYKIQRLRRQSLNDCPTMEGFLLLSEGMYKAGKAVMLSPVRLLRKNRTGRRRLKQHTQKDDQQEDDKDDSKQLPPPCPF